MSRYKTNIQDHPLASLALIALCVATIVGLPMSHHHYCDSLNESEFCPVYLMQTGLVLLGGALILILAARTTPELSPAISFAVPLPLFSPRFTYPDRAPPRPQQYPHP